MIAILILLLLGAVVLVVGAPLRAARRRVVSESQTASAARASTVSEAPQRQQELEAAREAKYREIRDTELDFRTGKLSREDYEAIDTQLRAEALEILNRLQAGDAVE